MLQRSPMWSGAAAEHADAAGVPDADQVRCTRSCAAASSTSRSPATSSSTGRCVLRRRGRRSGHPEEREAEYEFRWEAGGLSLYTSFADLIFNQEANDVARLPGAQGPRHDQRIRRPPTS